MGKAGNLMVSFISCTIVESDRGTHEPKVKNATTLAMRIEINPEIPRFVRSSAQKYRS